MRLFQKIGKDMKVSNAHDALTKDSKDLAGYRKTRVDFHH